MVVRQTNKLNPDGKKLLVLLIDGFRWDYLDKDGLELTGFTKLCQQGVRAERMVPDYPSLSYPNYYSIMTGLHVEDHGFCGNYMYCQKSGFSFQMDMKDKESQLPFWFEGAEPLWITAEKEGKKTAMMEWPGGHISNGKFQSSFAKKMDDFTRLPAATDNLKEAIQMLKTDKIQMAGVFVDDVDHVGHSHGPNSDLIKDFIKQTDDMIHCLLNSVSEAGLKDDLNIVIFSDHGMTDILGTVNIFDVLNKEDIETTANNRAVCSIWPKKDKVQTVYDSLTKLENPNITVYKKEDLPDRLFYKNNERIAPVVVIAKKGWLIVDENGLPLSDDGPLKGYHGYDIEDSDMGGIFLATGPGFKENVKCGPINAVDIYQVMSKLLGIKPLPHKGCWDNVSSMVV